MSVPEEIYLHVGLPKTGTTYLQNWMWSNRHRLARAGVLVPGEHRYDLQAAVWDLLGRRPRGTDLPALAGSWQRTVAATRSWSGAKVLLSHESLALARPRQIRKVVTAFAPARVHVVVTVRDLERVITATWQQELAKGRTWSWEEYLTAVRDPGVGVATAGVGFWLHQDLLRILDSWSGAVAHERIHVVTVPPVTAPRNELVTRFVAAIGVDAASLDMTGSPGNVSVGLAEAEVLRRLNADLGERLNERQYWRVVLHGVRPPLQERRGSTRIVLPAAHRGWVRERAELTVRELRDRGYRVEGDLADLLPDEVAGERPDPEVVDPGELADAALAALSGVVERYAEFWWRARKRDSSSDADAVSRLGTFWRGVGYRSRVSVLERADRSRLLHRVLAGYLRRAGR